MIILESDWDEAAGVAQDAEEGRDEDASSSRVSVLPSYTESVEKKPDTAGASASSTSIATSGAPSTSLSSSRQEHAAQPEALPGYHDLASSSALPVTHTFVPVQHSFNAMILQAQPISIPVYHISIQMNCFIPSSFITIVTRGDSVDGVEVGRFEMGHSVRKGTVQLEGREKVIDLVLTKHGTRHKMSRTWQWKFDGDTSKHLTWAFENPVKYCYAGARAMSDTSERLAVFTPPPLTPRSDGLPSPAALLQILPRGQKLFDHILMTALILERRRLTPD